MAKVEEEEVGIRPDVLQAALMHKVAKRLGDLTKLVEKQIEEGVVENLPPKTITTKPIVIQPPIWNKPWFGVKITNDGDKSAWVMVNTEKSTQPREIKPEETWGVHFNSPVIVDLYLYTEEGTTIARISGER